MEWKMLHPRATRDHLGMLPMLLNEISQGERQMNEIMRSIEETMRAHHRGDSVTDAELLQARIALESLAKAAAHFGEAMRPVSHYAAITAENMRRVEVARAEHITDASPSRTPSAPAQLE